VLLLSSDGLTTNRACCAIVRLPGFALLCFRPPFSFASADRLTRRHRQPFYVRFDTTDLYACHRQPTSRLANASRLLRFCLTTLASLSLPSPHRSTPLARSCLIGIAARFLKNYLRTHQLGHHPAPYSFHARKFTI